MSRLRQSVTVTPGGSNPESYTYDPYGNQTSRTTVGVAQNIAIDSSTNRLSGSGVSYDDSGSLRTWQPPNSAYSYAFSVDALDMVQAETANGNTTYYVYTADDERIW